MVCAARRSGGVHAGLERRIRVTAAGALGASGRRHRPRGRNTSAYRQCTGPAGDRGAGSERGTSCACAHAGRGTDGCSTDGYRFAASFGHRHAPADGHGRGDRNECWRPGDANADGASLGNGDSNGDSDADANADANADSDANADTDSDFRAAAHCDFTDRDRGQLRRGGQSDLGLRDVQAAGREG